MKKQIHKREVGSDTIWGTSGPLGEEKEQWLGITTNRSNTNYTATSDIQSKGRKNISKEQTLSLSSTVDFINKYKWKFKENYKRGTEGTQSPV